MTRIGTCACGQLQVKVEGDPDRVLACNCRECQRRTGSVFGVSAYFRDAQVVAVEGESRTFTRTSGGLRFDTGFCPSCGTSVLWRSSALPDHLAVAVGCFADPAFPQPTLVAWTAEQHAWVRFPESCRSFEKSAFTDDAAPASAALPEGGERVGGSRCRADALTAPGRPPRSQCRLQ